MGKRQRRRNHESGVEKTARPTGQQYQLGPPGPYMVCGLCGQPVNPYTFFDLESGQEDMLGYAHPQQYIDISGQVIDLFGNYDHEVLPVEGNPVDAETTCDFCHGPDPRYVFVPRRPVKVFVPIQGITNDFSTPWSCCEGCMPVVKRKDLARMLDRALNSRYSVVWDCPREEKRIYRDAIREVYAAYLKSAPAGPYEQKIAPRHKPYGTPRSRRGV